MIKRVIGITGSIGCGKSTVAKKIRALGHQVIDCDEIGHKLLLKNNLGYKKVVNAFGKRILNNNEEIERSILGKIIFDNQEERKKLNGILHPLIKDEVIKLINDSEEYLIFMECPLLFETDFHKLCDYKVVVYLDLDNQIWRVMKRDNIDFPQALKKIYAQDSLENKLDNADFIIDNCHNEGDLDWQIKQMILKIERIR